MGLTAPTLQLMHVLPYTAKSSIDLKALLEPLWKKICNFVSLMLLLDPLANLAVRSDSEMSLIKKSSLE